jgi:hypothetical protein
MLKLGWDQRRALHSHGKVFWRGSKPSNEGTFGGLEMAQKLISGLITGFLLVLLVRWLLIEAGAF